MNYYKPLFSFLMRKVSKNSGLNGNSYIKYKNEDDEKVISNEIELDICNAKLKNLTTEKTMLEDKIEELEEKLKIIDDLSFSMKEYFKYLKQEEKTKFILKLLKIQNVNNIKDANISINYGEIRTDVTYID